MRVVYIAEFDGNIHSGISKKLIAIQRAFKKNGVEARLIFLSRHTGKTLSIPGVELVKFPTAPYSSVMDKAASYLNTGVYFDNLKKVIREDEIVIFRNFFPSLQFLSFVKSCNRPVYVETVSNYYSECLMRKAYSYFALLKLFSPCVVKALAGVIGVTDELLEINFGRALRNKATYVMGNGIDPEQLPFEKAPFAGKYHMICVANLSKWHGLDRLLRGLHSARDEEHRVHLHIVGTGSAKKDLEVLVEELNIGDRVTFHGFMTGSPLDHLFAQCHLGIANLGTHLKKITQTSPLKSREYCARGLPFIYSAQDQDFPDGFPFAMRIPSNDDPISIPSLISFCESLSYDYPERMRAYALERLSYETKVCGLIDFIKATSCSSQALT